MAQNLELHHLCLQHRIKLLFWDIIDGSTPTHSPKSGWECPHRWRNSLIFGSDMTPKQRVLLGTDLGRFFGQTWAQHRLNIEGCVGPLGALLALLAAFGPKISIPTEAWFRWGWILGLFWAYVGPFGGYVGPLLGHFRAMLGLCWVIWGSAGGFWAEKKKTDRNVFRSGVF